MKKIFLLMACAGLLLTSCDSFLDENPKSSLTLNDFNKSDAHFLGQVNYLYRNGASSIISGASSAYMGSFVTMNGMLTGYFSNAYEGQERTCYFARTLSRHDDVNTVSGSVDGVWDNCYRTINVANSVIANIENQDAEVSAANKAQYTAEAKFFRAYNYFLLVKTFGDVPLTTKPYTSADQDMRLPRTAKAEVFKLIEQDLKDAVSGLKAETWQNNKHRVTKYVAEMALTDVYMFQGKYSEAAASAKDIINSGKYALTTNDNTGLGSAYNKLRSTDDLSEVVYAFEYDNSISTSNWWPTYAFDAGATSVFNKYAIYERVYGPNGQFLNVYPRNDLRIQEKQFFAKSYTNERYTVDGVTSSRTWKMNGFDKDSTGVGYRDQIGCWYYFDQNANEETGRGTKDWNFYRYAETLLDAAEAIAQTSGVTTEAVNYLAQVQQRAYPSKTRTEIVAELQQLTKEKFLEACWTERLREFPLEFKIWDDCVRTGKFPVISTTTPGQVTYVNLVGATNAAGAVFKQSDLVWPISINEIQRNPQLTQNEGY